MILKLNKKKKLMIKIAKIVIKMKKIKEKLTNLI